MVKRAGLLALLLLSPAFLPLPNAEAVWQDELFGHPPPAYFASVYTRLLEWAESRYLKPGDLSPQARSYLRQCARSGESWYHPAGGERRLAVFQLKLSAPGAGLHRLVKLRCLAQGKNAKLEKMTKELVRKAGTSAPKEEVIGFEFTLGSGQWALLTGKREITLEGKRLERTEDISPFHPGPPPAATSFSFPALSQAVSSVKSSASGKVRYRLELKAYVHGIAPAALKSEIEAVHSEFGLLADTITVDPANGIEVSFP